MIYKQSNLNISVPSGTTDTFLPYRLEITLTITLVRSNPDSATVIHGKEPREQNCPCSPGGLEGWNSLSPVNHSSTNQL